MTAKTPTKLLCALACILLMISSSHGWTVRNHHLHSSSSRTSSSFRKQSVVLKASPTSSADRQAAMGGVSDFETWFQTIEGAKCDSGVRHAQFGAEGNLRGLTYSQDAASSSTIANPILTIPKSVVLDSDFTQSDWDTKLAIKLWKELQKGSSSSISGYIQLLSKGVSGNDSDDSAPPSTAPDALRHWTPDQLKILSSSKTASSQRLLDLLEQQNSIWRKKYDDLDVSDDMTWEQFCWAMEVVHSRAFCGDFGTLSGNGGSSKGSLSPVIAGGIGPIVAAIAGLIYYIPFHGQNDSILVGFAVLGILPTLLSLMDQSSAASAVLLPFIDSANHIEDADSKIEYDPLSNAFTLNAGSKCIITEDAGNKSNSKPQLYISYGQKKDAELLLNYGFLPGVSLEGKHDERRKNLAEAFVTRN